MDARPNVLNKILPCTQEFALVMLYGQGTIWRAYGFNVHRLDPTSAEHVIYNGIVPNNIKEGSDVIIQLKSLPYAINDSGVDKGVAVLPHYGSVRKGQAMPALTVGDIIDITIPDDEAAYTLHYDDVMAFHNLQAGDMLGVKLYREPTDGFDDYPDDYCFYDILNARYIADKVGVI